MIGCQNLKTRVVDGALGDSPHHFAIEFDGTEVGRNFDAAELTRLRQRHLMRDAQSADGRIEHVHSGRAYGSADRLR